MPELRAQRTLVKSPPELWAQLSDPVSLSRHLGEFGEIRITRVVPEQTVAWEGERASGTVELSSSGWGTKVTLVAQLADDANPAADADPVPQPEPAVAQASPSETRPADEPRPADAFALINSLAREPLPRAPEPIDTDEAEADSDADIGDGPVEPHAPDEAGLMEAPAHVAGLVEPPELDYASYEQVEPPGGEDVDRPDEAADVFSDQEHGHAQWFSQSPGPTHAAGDPHAWTAGADAASTRPGFFARLFGRRRGATSLSSQPASAPWPSEHEEPVSPTPIPEDEVAPIDGDLAPIEHEAAPTAAEPDGEHEVAQAEADTAWAEDEVAPVAPEPEPEHEVTPTETDGAWTEHEVTPTAAEPAPDHDAAQPADEPVATIDPARAEAVLTAVLDDLGAARHRPFSRG